MKNNKIIIYLGLIAVGLLLGWFLFGGTSQKETEHHHDEVTGEKQMWTCSMHPQIMQPEPGDCPICGMDLIPAETNSDGLLAGQFKLTENAMALANIQTTVVGNAVAGSHGIKLSGKIVENEETNTVQVSHFAGRIETLRVGTTGAYIKQGQLLATIYSPELFAAQQELITTASIKSSQPELYKAVKNKLLIKKLTDKQINAIEASGEPIQNFPIYATHSGTVIEKLVEQGDHVSLGQPLYKIANLSQVWANFDVYENQIDVFKKGQEVLISTNAYPDKQFKAQVDFIDPVLDTKTRTVKMRVVLNNKDNLLKPGMFVEGSIQGHSADKAEVLSIPASAVLWTGKRSVVYLKTNSSVFEMREITLGNQIGTQYVVLDGLQNGDEIVTNGTFTVDAAAQLQGKKSMMNKSGGKVMTGHEGHAGMHHGTSSNESGTQTNENARLEVPKAFQKQLKVVYDDYIKIKNALVEDDSEAVIDDSKALSEHLKKVDMNLLTSENAHKEWMPLKEAIHTSAEAISKTTAITQQRHAFKNLSTLMAKTLQIFGIGEKVYYQFCPMADDNNGAYWLSNEQKVINPYFGAAMISCGEIKQIIE
ncbi:efflux RND transporter periplasmic adaptor subunit [Tamlana sp. I1]|uniref:efflux RND transporter periplasmic adaptor subunit n=1 Tax=Tamlana sp. I1 TaxID=2762061 RepID=UPI00188E34F6|nr:efflux RND transporter periplasmic adaptor subunit [Tamlana sp. I1]